MVGLVMLNLQISINGTHSAATQFANEVISAVCAGDASQIAPFLIEKNVNIDELDDCSTDVFNAIKASVTNDFARILSRLDSDIMPYQVTIKTQHHILENGTQSSAAGSTVRNSAYNYTIYINPDYSGKTKLFIANVLIHEMIHAYFLSLYDDYIISGNPTILYDYNFLYSQYVNKVKEKTDWHHEQIAQNFITIMAEATQSYQTGNSMPLQQPYVDLAWTSLVGTQPFNNRFLPDDPDLPRIINRGICEQLGTSYGYSSPPVQHPIGEPCN
ncbi:MAG TPA: hypothetical protein PLA69_00870 [Flavobacterium sp.]|nr:hypothetical protein [Flavobacterium sp.]